MDSQLDTELDRFLLRVARYQSNNAVNPYGKSVEGHRRLGNLRRYLSQFRPPSTCDVLLIGEAFGYRGGRVTGVPLCSEAVIRGNTHFATHFPTIAREYVPCGEAGALSTEATATIVWRAFADLDVCPCCWNIFPLHPFDPARGQWSNRAPTRVEIASGARFCRELIALVHPLSVIAMGRCAAAGLHAAGIDHVAVRHPSQGGARIFRSQFAQAIETGRIVDLKETMPY